MKFFLLILLLSSLSFTLLGSEIRSKENLLKIADELLHREFPDMSEENKSIIGKLDSLVHQMQRDNLYEDSALFILVRDLGVMFLERGRHVCAIKLFTESLSYFEKKKEKSKQSIRLETRLTSVLGASYEEIGIWHKAMELYQKALAMMDLHHFEPEKAMVYNNIANVHYKRNNLDKARALWDTALYINKKYNNHPELFNVYYNLSNLSITKKNYEEALEYSFTALQYLNKKKDTYLYSLTQLNIGNIYFFQKEYSLAETYILNSIKSQKNYNYDLTLIQSYSLLSDIYRLQNKDALFLSYLLMALDISEKIENMSCIQMVLQKLSSYYAHKKDFKNAYSTMERFSRVSDSIYNLNNQRKIEDLTLFYESERKHQENNLLTKELAIKNLSIQRQRVFILLLIVIALAVFILLRYHKINENKMREAHRIMEEQKNLIKQQDLEMSVQREEELKNTLESRNRELTAKILHLLKNNEFIVSITDELKTLLLEINPKDTQKKEHLKEILAKLRMQSNDGTYEEFKFYFEQVHQSFYDNILAKYPGLTYKDLRLCAFLKLGLSTKEIATITFRELRSIESSRNRLRKKMDIDQNENLIDFFSQF